MHIATRKNKAWLRLSIAAAILVSSASHAFIIGPIHDPANTLENLSKQLADLEQRIVDEAYDLASRKLQTKLLESVGIASATEAASKQQADQKLKQNIRNSDIAMENTPVFNICDEDETYNNKGIAVKTKMKGSILSFSLRSDDFCGSLQASKDSKIDEIKEITLPNGNADEVVKNKFIEKKEIIFDKLTEEVIETSTVNIDRLMPDKYFGLTQEEYNTAQEKAFIMFSPKEPSSSNKMLRPQGLAEEISKSMRSSMPYQVITEQLADKLKPNSGTYSERESQEQFANEFYNSENIERYTYNAMINIDQVTRERAIMKAFEVHMAIQEYKKSLNKEVLKSINLLENIPN